MKNTALFPENRLTKGVKFSIMKKTILNVSAYL